MSTARRAVSTVCKLLSSLESIGAFNCEAININRSSERRAVETGMGTEQVQISW